MISHYFLLLVNINPIIPTLTIIIPIINIPPLLCSPDNTAGKDPCSGQTYGREDRPPP